MASCWGDLFGVVRRGQRCRGHFQHPQQFEGSLRTPDWSSATRTLTGSGLPPVLWTRQMAAQISPLGVVEVAGFHECRGSAMSAPRHGGSKQAGLGVGGGGGELAHAVAFLARWAAYQARVPRRWPRREVARFPCRAGISAVRELLAWPISPELRIQSRNAASQSFMIEPLARWWSRNLASSSSIKRLLAAA